ncbi:MAG: non-heme iron oxygenase ferredoxin subunit [Candidatus Peregrinibacteria bacterium]|nr:non-heme iron oxygenase ferredoxin subunit [Candidatus Peregrinibacteria bacterium]
MFMPTVSIENLKSGEKTKFEINGIKLMIANINDAAYAVQRYCSHAESDLTEGNLEGCVIECALHGAMFDVRDGKVLSLPATQPLKTYPTKIENGMILVDIPEVAESA